MYSAFAHQPHEASYNTSRKASYNMHCIVQLSVLRGRVSLMLL